MKKLLSIALVSSSLLVASGAVFAKAQTGIVVGGQANWTFASGDITTGTSTKSGFGVGGLLGFDYALNSAFSLGLEVDGQYAFNTLKLGNTKVSFLSVPVYLVGKFYIPDVLDGLNVFGKVGGSYNHLTYTNSPNGGAFNFSAAAGVGYEVMDNLNIFAQYQYIAIAKKTNVNPKGALQNISLGLTYTIPVDM